MSYNARPKKRPTLPLLTRRSKNSPKVPTPQEEAAVMFSRKLVPLRGRLAPFMSIQNIAQLSGIPIAMVREIDERLCAGAREAANEARRPSNLARKSVTSTTQHPTPTET